jgi:hypothetical protein
LQTAWYEGAVMSFDELERAWTALPFATAGRGTVHLIVLRIGDGQHSLPWKVDLSPSVGVVGDRWLGSPNRTPEGQLSLIDSRVAQLLAGGKPEEAHLPGDNFHVDLDLSEDALPVGTQLRLGTALIEITAKPHAGCSKFSARVGEEALRWVNDKERRSRRLRGVYAKVIGAGTVSIGQSIAIER